MGEACRYEDEADRRLGLKNISYNAGFKQEEVSAMVLLLFAERARTSSGR